MKRNLTNIILLFTITFSAFYSKAQNVKLVDYTLFPCEEFYINTRYIQERIVEISLNSDTLKVLVTTEMNCASGEKASIQVQGDSLYLYSDFPDSIPNIINKGDTISWSEPDMADCSCCFTLEYKIKDLQSKDYIVLINDKVLELLPNKYLLPEINKYGDTTAFLDEDGFFHTRTYNLLGELRFERKLNAFYSNTKEYYRNGQLRREEEFDRVKSETVIKEYDESGKLLNNEIR